MRTRGIEIEGTVTQWRDEKGTGRVAGDDGHEYWVHHSMIITDGYGTLEVGQRVRLRWKGDTQDSRRRPTVVWPLA